MFNRVAFESFQSSSSMDVICNRSVVAGHLAVIAKDNNSLQKLLLDKSLDLTALSTDIAHSIRATTKIAYMAWP